MVHLPRHPLREITFGEEHPMVAAAQSKLGRNDKCWCGSERKYKDCHLHRASEKPLKFGQAKKKSVAKLWARKTCMHPEASPSNCSGPAIGSHSIHRKGVLAKIVDEKNHLIHFDARSGQTPEPQRIGWKKASVFPGFCSTHDSSTFGPIETQPFTGSEEQCFLLGYRAACSEIYRKTGLIDSLEDQRSWIDRGKTLEEQISIQASYAKNIEGHKKSLEESLALQAIFNEALQTGDLSKFASRAYFFDGSVSLVSTSCFQCEWDFAGNQLVDLWDLELDADLLCHAMVDTENGGAIVFTWLRDAKSAQDLVDSFDAIEDSGKGDCFVQYCILNCENTYFSSEWWNSLPSSRQATFKRYAKALSYDGGAITPSRPLSVDWKFTSCVSYP